MIGSIRKFSETIYAKIILIIVIIPFIFWGMGSSFNSGKRGVVLTIDKEKYSIQEFSQFINNNATKSVQANEIENFLSSFISEKLIEKEIKHFNIELSDNSLKKLIKHQKGFKRDNVFSRTEYEKFLLKNNITAVNFESIISKQEKKKQLLDLISGGIVPPKSLVNVSYDRINQKRSVELINLNDIFLKDLNFTIDEIRNFYEDNKDKYSEIYKSGKILELNPKKLVNTDDFNDLFFKKIDEIDDLIVGGEKLDSIIKNFNLEQPIKFKINKEGKDFYNAENKNISEGMVVKIFDVNIDDSVALIEEENKYFIIELLNTENGLKDFNNSSVQKNILNELSKVTKRKLIGEYIDRINKKNFTKSDFNELSNIEKVKIQKISFKNSNDDSVLKKGAVSQIYSFPEGKIIVVHDLSLSENFLVFINKVENVTINENSDEYEKYLNLSRVRMVSDLFNTYDIYLKQKYEIDINYQALDEVKNYFN
jgi:peptidyl-prolyl cis-trans isomerase D